ncbi:MAG TPA: methylmalonyl Co-A mutase-associated GTPase MeaB [Firmicutes bacterium]|jgi:LAO/AO transport system kinase|nr:methylmalonyl Co-A mutase-associated GTPase MeaB [Bacillota bacterium]
MDWQEIVSRALSREVRAVSRLISIVEDRRAGFEDVYAAIYPRTGRAHVIGITGPPGSGKSTLVDKIAAEYRSRGKTVGIVAVDPTSPFTGGALLGDRLRMQRHSLDNGVFIRSMGTRGHLGGLSRATSGVVDVLDAAGYDYVVIETVGVGQSEVEIASLADTVALVQVPGLGDDIQVIKAGVMEIGDVFVVNKKDRPGVERVVAEIRMSLDLAGKYSGHHGPATAMAAATATATATAAIAANAWHPPILQTMAESGEGVAEVCEACDAHMRCLVTDNALVERRFQRARSETMKIASDLIWRGLADDARTLGAAEGLAWKVARREIDPYAAGRDLRELVVS